MNERRPPAQSRERLGADQGSWPTAIQQFWWDLLPAKKAPAKSGIGEPTYSEPAWLKQPNSGRAEVAEYAKRAHDLESARAEEAEGKAFRLAQTCLGMLALSLALVGYQVGVARTLGGGWWYLLVAPAALGIGFLVVAGIQALEIDRVGLYSPGTPEEAVEASDPLVAISAAEERARWYARWTAGHKFNALLQARAWFSRSLVALLVAAISAAGSQAIPR